MKNIRRLIRNGNSTQVTIEARLLEFLRWRAGDYVTVELTERGTLEVRPATTVDMRAEAPRRPMQPVLVEDAR